MICFKGRQSLHPASQNFGIDVLELIAMSQDRPQNRPSPLLWSSALLLKGNQNRNIFWSWSLSPIMEMLPGYGIYQNARPRPESSVVQTYSPLIIILMTASLSSKMFNRDSPWEECALVGTKSTFDKMLHLSLSRFTWCFGCVFTMEWSLVPPKYPWVLVYHVLQCCLLNVTLQSPCPKRSRASSPCAIQHPKIQTLWNCGILSFVSCTSNWCGRMFDFQRYIRLLPRLTSSPQGRQQSLSLEINPADNAEQCNPHDTIVGSHLCDECMKSILPSVCHKLESNLWLTTEWMSGRPIRAKYKLGRKNRRSN